MQTLSVAMERTQKCAIYSRVFSGLWRNADKKIKASQIPSPAIDGQDGWGDERHAETRAPAPLFTFLPFTMFPCSFSTHSHIAMPTTLLNPFQVNQKKDPHLLQGTRSTFPAQPALISSLH